MIHCHPRIGPRVGQAGFTFLEIVVVIAIIALLAGTIAPMANASLSVEKTNSVRVELAAVAVALEDHYAQNAAFPASLTATSFYGVCVLPGVDDARLRDDWAGNHGYFQYALTSNPDTAIVWSVGSNGINDGSGAESLRVIVRGARTGADKTRQRIAVIAARLAQRLSSGGSITGTWSTDRVALGLGAEYATDGFGTAFQLLATDYVIRSAGPDRSFATTVDNITN